MTTPAEHPDTASASPEESNRFLVGFGAAWGTALAASVLAWAIAMVIEQRMHALGQYGEKPLLAGMLPPACLLGLLGWSYVSGRRELARGVLAAFGSMFAVVLLLIAACFGMFGFNAF